MSAATAVVLDASVAVKWYLPELGSAEARIILDQQRARRLAIHVPDLFFVETGNILWKRVRRHEMDEAKATEIATALLTIPEFVHPSSSLLAAAVSLACRYNRTVYDSLYVTLASTLGCKFITADVRLVNALATTPAARFIDSLLSIS